MRRPNRATLAPAGLFGGMLLSLLAQACGSPAHGAQEPGAAVRPPAARRGGAPDPRADLALLTQGANALAANQPQEAEELLGAYLEQDPGCGMALFLRGVALLDLGRVAEARDALRASVEADPDDASGHAVLARIEFEAGDLEAAAASLERAVECAPGEAQHWTSLGLVHLELDHWGEAYDALLEAVRLDPRAAGAHRALGRLYVQVAEFELAERAYRTALDIEPDDVALRVALAHVLRDLARPAEAVEHYREALEREPTNPWLEANVASSLMELDRPREARGHFEAALERLDGQGLDEALISLNYGGCLERLGDLDGAESAYDSAVAAAPELGRAHEALGLLQLNLGEERRAARSLGEAFRLGDIHPDSLLDLTLLLERQGDWARAQECARTLLDDPSAEPSHLFRRARLRLRSRDPSVQDASAAAALLRPLVEGDLGRQPAPWELLAEACTQLGDLEEAIGAVDGALSVVAPNSPVRARFERQREHLVSQLEDAQP